MIVEPATLRARAPLRETIFDAMALLRIASLEELPPGALLEKHAAGRTFALCNDAGTIHAFQGLCPHHGGPLGQGNFVDGRILCPWHAWEFNVEDGALDFNPQVRLQRFGVEVRGGEVFVEIP